MHAQILLYLLLALISAAAAGGDKPEILVTPSGLKFVRTPSTRFNIVRGFPSIPRFTEVSGLRMAYIDAGYATKGTILLLHGEPTWSYLYRSLIPVFSQAGYRVIVPDLIGFGRSDKPISNDSYTVDSHVDWMKSFLQNLGLSNIHAFLHDWGGPIGLTIAAEDPSLFNRLILANTLLPNGTNIPGFKQFQDFIQTVTPLIPSTLIAGGANMANLSANELAAYDAPFPSEIYLAGVRKFPLLIAIAPDGPGLPRFLAAREKLKSWARPVLMQWGLSDPGLGQFYRDFRALIPGTNGQPHELYTEAGHFLQEDVGGFVAEAVVRWLDSDSTASCRS